MGISRPTREAFETYVEIARKEISTKRGPRLAVLDEYLEKGRDMLGCSKNEMKKWASLIGLCLMNFKPYHDQLGDFLRENRNMIVPRKKAKSYEFVKVFLIKL